MAGSWVRDLSENGAFLTDVDNHPYALFLGDTVPVGDRVVVLGINTDTVTDTRGNTYSIDGVDGALYVWSAPVTTELIPGDAINITSPVTDYGFSASQFTGITDVSGYAAVPCSRTDWGDPPTEYDTGPVAATRDEWIMLSVFVYRTQEDTVTTPARSAFFGDYAVAMVAAGGVVSSHAAQATALWRYNLGCADINDTGEVVGGPGICAVLLVLYGCGETECPGDDDDEDPSDFAIDLAETQLGFLHRTYRDNDNGLNVDTSRDAGATWDVVALTAGLPDDSAPTLCALPNDDLLVWYHTSSSHAFAWRSDDYGATWVLHADVSGIFKRYPRAVWTLDGLRLAAHDGEETLRIYRSEDFGVTLSEIWQTTAEEQLVAFTVDRRGWLHLFYQGGGSVLHRYSDDGGVTWSSATTLVTGELPSVSFAWDRALLAYWVSDTLALRMLSESYGALAETPGAVPAGLDTPTWLGLLWSAHRPSLIYAAGKDGDQDLHLAFTDDHGAAWAAPT